MKCEFIIMSKNYRETLNERMKDSSFKQAWDDLEPEFDIIEAIIKTRTSQNITQKELSDRTGIPQADLRTK